MSIRISVNRVDLDDKTLQKPIVKDYGETRIAENSGASFTIDLTRGNVYEVTLTGNVTFTFSNPPASGTHGHFTLILKQDATGSRTVTWPSSVKWPNNGTVPTISSYKYSPTVIGFSTTDGGTTWWGMLGGTNMKTTLGPGLFVWGNNTSGQLGLGDAAHRSSPAQVGSFTTWAAVAGGSSHSLAIKSNGTLWAWGLGTDGALGLGDAVNRTSPVQVGSLTTWTELASGYGAFHSIARKSDGTLWSWGRNVGGCLGLGDTVYRSSPVQIGALASWVSASMGVNHVLAIKSDGTLWAWGQNTTDGRLGLGDTADRSSPVQVGSLTTWTAVVSAGRFHSVAIQSDGTLWTWGRNSNGQLGLGDTASRSSPVQVGSLTTWIKISCGGYHTLAIDSGGALWGWGLNAAYQGQLGLGDGVNRSSPSQIGSLTSWVAVAGGYRNSHALKSDGTLWAWGTNTNGLLGLGDIISRSSPVQVGALTIWNNISRGKNHTIALN